MGRLDRVCVVGIEGMGTVLPDVDVAEAFLPQLSLE